MSQKPRSKPSQSKGPSSAPQPERPAKGALQATGILFAVAVNVLLVTSAHLLVTRLGLPLNAELLATFVGPVLAGALTAFYVKQRGGIHAFIGGLITIPITTFVVFGGNWQLGIFAGAFCGLAGALTEIALRRRTSPSG